MKPNPSDEDAIPPLASYAPESEFYDRAVLPLAWRRVGPDEWEGRRSGL
ncbi:hypothetical protein [Nonomuraea sp. NPDC005650]